MIYVIADRTPWASATETERETCAPACKSRKARMPRYFFHVIDGIETIDSEGTVLATSRRPAPKPSCSRARCCETAAASSGTTASGSCASSTPPAIRSVPSHSRPIALKGAVTAFLEAMLGVVPRLGVSLALIIAHEDQRPALALSCYSCTSRSNRRSTGSWRNLSRRRSRSRLAEGRQHHASDRGYLRR